MADDYYYSAALVGGPPWGFRVACTDPQDSSYAVYVAQVIPQSRADNERIQAGDVLVTVNGRDVAGLKLHEVQRLLKRSTGIIRLTLRQNPSGRTSTARSPQPRIQEIPVQITETPSPRSQTESPYRRTKKRLGPGTDHGFAYNSEIEDSNTDYIYRPPVTRLAASVQEGLYSAPKTEYFQSTEIKQQIGSPVSASLRTWAPVQFAPILVASAPVSPSPGMYNYKSTSKISSRTVTTTGNGSDKYLLNPESASSKHRPSGSLSEEDRSGTAREEGSLTPKLAVASSSSTTPVVTDTDVMQTSQPSYSTAPVDAAADLQASVQSLRSAGSGYPNLGVESGLKSDQPTPMYSFKNTDEGRNGERIVATVAPFAPSHSRAISDDLIFYAESTCSDHPSLATSSLGFDFNDRTSRDTSQQADADESVISDYSDFLSGLRSGEQSFTFEPRFTPTPMVQRYGASESIENGENGQGDSENGRTGLAGTDPAGATAGSEPKPDDNGTTEKQLSGEISAKETQIVPTSTAIKEDTGGETEKQMQKSLDSFLATQPEPHYPHAFEPQNIASNGQSRPTTAPNEAASMASGPTTSYNPYEPYSSSLRGPSFKTSQQPAIWTPKVGSSDSLSTKAVGARVYDVPTPPTAASNQTATQAMPGYAPGPFFTDSATDQHQATTTAMSGGGNASGTTAPPPPPPPPPPSASGGGRYLESVKAAKAAQEVTDAAIAADPNRSIVEYPEKQSVASLRSAIANKFNGGVPIKGSLPSPGQESVSIKEQVTSPVGHGPVAPSSIDISIQRGHPPSAPQPYQPYQSVSNATKAVEDAAANAMSSVVGGAGIGYSRSDQSHESRTFANPLSIGAGVPGPGRWTSATPPVRPPLPAGMKSPTPPMIPPAPTGFTMQPSPTMSSSSLASSGFRFGGRPDNFARPYERTSIRGTDIPSGGIVTERRMSDGDHYAIPYRETTTVTRRRIARTGDGNYKYDDIGPVDATGTPLGLRELVPGSDQHQWYKKMYKKMHQIDRKDDASVLRYRLRDAVGDRYIEERSPRRRLGSSTGSSPQRVGYKFTEFMADLPDEEGESGGMEFDRSYIPKPFHIFGERPSRGQDRDIYGRNRSKSANRYEMTNTPPPYAAFPSQPLSTAPSEPMKSDTSGPRPYQFPASRPTDYAPVHTTQQYEQEKRRVDQLSNRPQSAVAFGARYDYQSPHHARGEAADSTTFVQRRRELSPMRRDEARQWYQSVQTGGDAPFGGFRQPAPERRDSLFRAAWLYARLLSLNGHSSARKRDVCVQTTSGDRSITLTSVTPLKTVPDRRPSEKMMMEQRRSLSPSKVPALNGGPSSPLKRDAVQDSPLRTCSSGPTTPRKSYVSSPVKTQDPGSKLYAMERAKTKDFHLPFFRLTPSPPKSRCSERAMDWEIDTYFTYLRKICDEEPSRSNKCVQTVDTGGQRRTYASLSWKTYDEILMEQRRKEEEFQRTYQILHDALKDIEILASPKVRQRKIRTDEKKNGLTRQENFYWVGNGARTEGSSFSAPCNLDWMRHGSACFCSKSSGFRQEKTGYRPAVRYVQIRDSPVPKRASSLPELTNHLLMVSSKTWPPQVARNQVLDYRRLPDLEDESADSTDVSLIVDSEFEETGSISERPTAPVMNGTTRTGCERLRHCSEDTAYLHTLTSNNDGLSSRACNDTSEKESGCMSADFGPNHNGLDVKRLEPPHLYAAADTSSRTTRMNDRLDFDIDEFSRLERELTQEDERRKRQLKELEDQKAKWQGSNVASAQFSPSVGHQHPQEPDLRGVAKALYNFVAQTNREVSFRKGDLIKIRRQVDDHWYEGEVHGKVGIVPINYVDLAATAIGDDRTTLTEVSTKKEGLSQVLYNFEGKNVNELPLRKGEFIVLTKKVDENWLEGRNSFGRRGIFPINYVKIVNDASSKTTDYVTAYTGSGQQTFVRGDDPLKPLPNGSQLYETTRNIPTAPPAFAGGVSRARATAPPQQISNTIGASNTDLISKARELAQNVRKELGGSSVTSGAEALEAALSAGQPDTFQALFPYKPQNPDELELKENDIVYVVERCDDGWYIGTSLRTGRFGTFPGNYVKRL